MQNTEDKIVVNERVIEAQISEIETQIVEYIYKHGDKLRFLNKNHPKNQSKNVDGNIFEDIFAFKLEDIIIIQRVYRREYSSGDRIDISVDKGELKSKYAIYYLHQLLDDVLNNKPRRKFPVQPQRILELENVLEKFKKIDGPEQK